MTTPERTSLPGRSESSASILDQNFDLVSQRERERITSGFRLSVALMLMVITIVASLTALILFLVGSVFDSMRPSVASDLEWKAVRGAVELSKTAELGLLLHDEELVRKVASDYLENSDVDSVIAIAADGQVVFEHGGRAANYQSIFDREPQRVHTQGGEVVAWSPATIEGQTIGRVLVAVSSARLLAGDELQTQITAAALAGGALAILLALGFVWFYLWPILRITQHAFLRLEHTTHLALSAARLKAQFLANMSHEIRTPMNAVVGLAKLMLGMPLGPKVRRYAERIDSSARSLLNIINDILDFSKLEAGKYQILRAPCEPALAVQEVAELLAERAQSKGVDLVYRVAPEVPRVVEADQDRLRQVLTNLVGNAVKFTEKGEVFIQVSVVEIRGDRAMLRFEVQDSGIGVPEQQRAHIFESFSQADGSMNRRYGGTGLGLAISRQLVQLMDGEIGLTSEMGKGSCFWFTLPARVVDESPAIRAQPSSLGKHALLVCDNLHARTALEEHVRAWGMTAVSANDEREALAALRPAGSRFDVVLISETQHGTRGAQLVAAIQRACGTPPPVVLLSQVRSDGTRSEIEHEIAAQLAQPVRMSELYECLTRVLTPDSALAAPANPHAKSHDFRAARILVVDDNEMNQFVAAEQLARYGCHVDQAFNGQEALERVLNNDYALVLMDCQMPVMDGYTATEQIRAREAAGKHTVIVALTAHALEGERERVLRAGMDDYLTKPVRPQTLERTLARWIKVSEREAAKVANDNAAQVPGVDAEPETENLASCSDALLEMFLSKVPEQLELLDGALASLDPQDVRAHAHKLKGSLLVVTAHDLAKLAHRLQLHGEAEDLTQSEETFKLLLDGFYGLEKRVKQELYERTRAVREQRGSAHERDELTRGKG